METHIPVLFLDLSGTVSQLGYCANSSAALTSISTNILLPLLSSCPADDFQSSLSAPLAGGLDAGLSEEDDDEFFDLHIVKHFDPEVK